MIELVCWAVLGVRSGNLGVERVGQDVAVVELDPGIGLEDCAAVRSPRLWLSPYRGEL